MSDGDLDRLHLEHKTVCLKLELAKLEARRGSYQRVNWTIVGSVLAAAIPALIAILAGILVENTRARAQLEANLILEATRTGDRQEAIDNLLFFLQAGFIRDRDGRIAELAAQDIVPTLPSNSSGTMPRAISPEVASMAECLDLAGGLPERELLSISTIERVVEVRTCLLPTKENTGRGIAHVGIRNLQREISQASIPGIMDAVFLPPGREVVQAFSYSTGSPLVATRLVVRQSSNRTLRPSREVSMKLQLPQNMFKQAFSIHQ